jgi:hypothetical protein
MFTKIDAHREGWDKMNAYRDGHCAGFNLWHERPCNSQVGQQAYDRGYQVGMQARRELDDRK